MTDDSWWLCPDAEFSARAARELPRMAESKIGQWQMMGYELWPSPPRRTHTLYTYALEQRRVDAA